LSSPVPPSDPGQGGAEDAPPIEPAPPASSLPTPPAPARLGASTFTIEGRSAPALFVIGWLATLVGFGLIAVGLMSGKASAGAILVIVGLVVLSIGLVAAAGSQAVERRVRGVLAYRGPSPFLVLLAAVPISILGLIVVSVPLRLLGIPLEGPEAALISVSLQALVYIGLVRLLVVDTGALDWVSMGVRRFDRTAALEMFGGALWAAPLVVITGIVASILLNLVPVEPVSPLPPSGTTGGLIVSLVAGAVVAPFGEEILFRGFATTAWVRARGMRGGLILGALIFAFAHVVTVSGTTAGDALQQALVAFVGRIPIALALGVLFVRRGTIWASFGLHAAFNAILLVLAELLSRSI
jgi:membrane protease YdiL (CAAX protease family)